jgi:RNA polymerase sigma-70 factor, ECF subfamily
VDTTRFDDEALIRLIAHSHPDALSALYDRYNHLIYGLALTVVGDPALAEEITQDVFMRIWNRAGTYRSEQGKVTGWMISIARNRAIDALRHQKTIPEGNSLSWDDLPLFDPPDGHNVEQEVELEHQKWRLRQALFQLPKEQRDALALAYFKGYTHEEMAQILGEPLGTIKTRVRLGMQKMRQILEVTTLGE